MRNRLRKAKDPGFTDRAFMKPRRCPLAFTWTGAAALTMGPLTAHPSVIPTPVVQYAVGPIRTFHVVKLFNLLLFDVFLCAHDNTVMIVLFHCIATGMSPWRVSIPNGVLHCVCSSKKRISLQSHIKSATRSANEYGMLNSTQGLDENMQSEISPFSNKGPSG